MKRYILNLDNGFSPCKSGAELKIQQFDFRGGEPHVQILLPEFFDGGELVITQRYNDPRDFMMILLAHDAAKRVGFKHIELVLPYFPAARQDRVCNYGEALTIKVFTELINNCKFEKVYIYSPHSEVTPALLNNVQLLDLDSLFVRDIIIQWKISKALFHKDPEDLVINVVCPDSGAGKRVGKIVQKLVKDFPENTFNLIRCEKVRDVATGELKEFFVQADDLGGHTTLIIDDVLCMGGTFIGLGEELKKKNCGKKYLFTSHADCIDGLRKMITFFDGVYTTNSKQNWADFEHNLKCFKIEL